MTRDDCERLIARLVEEIRDLHEMYNPNANYFTIAVYKDSYWFNNEYWDEDDRNHDGRGKDADYPLNYYKYTEEEE